MPLRHYCHTALYTTLALHATCHTPHTHTYIDIIQVHAVIDEEEKVKAKGIAVSKATCTYIHTYIHNTYIYTAKVKAKIYIQAFTGPAVMSTTTVTNNNNQPSTSPIRPRRSLPSRKNVQTTMYNTKRCNNTTTSDRSRPIRQNSVNGWQEGKGCMLSMPSRWRKGVRGRQVRQWHAAVAVR